MHGDSNKEVTEMDGYGYVFPYMKIDKGSQIIIWGAGEVGRQYWYQIKQTDYCKIIAVIDKEVRIGNAFIDVKPISALKDYRAEYVLLAIAAYEKRKEAREYITEFYPDLTCVEADYYGDSCQIELSSAELCEAAGWKRLFDQFWKYSLGNFSYIRSLIDEVKRSSDKERIVMNVMREISDWNPCEQVVAMRMLMLSECFNAELMKLYYSALSNIEDHELCAVLLEEIASFELSHSEICYPEYFNDRRKTVKNNTYALLKDLSVKESHSIMVRQEIKKICILRQNLPSAKVSNATKWVVEWANIFLHLGYQVMVLSASLFEGQRIVSFINASWDEPYDENSGFFESDVLVRRASGRTIAERMQSTISMIRDYNPDLVIDTCSHHDMLTCVLYKMFPLLHIPFRGSNSSTFFHRSLLQSEKQYEAEWETFHSIPRELARFATYVNVKFSEGRDISNEKRDEFHIATAGNRVKKELSEEFIDLMCTWLQSKNNARWYIIGPMQANDLNYKYHDFVESGKIIFSGYQKALGDYYIEAKIDIMVYPPITGVGMCASLAANNHIPVIKSKSNGDIEKYLGEEAAVEGNLADLISYLDELYYDASERKKLAQNELAHLQTFEDGDKYVFRILEAGKEILSDLQQEINFESKFE